jgi:hypothetical protein
MCCRQHRADPVTRQTGARRCKRLCFRYRAVVEVMVAIETSVQSLAAHPQNETLKDILARDTVDRLTLTLWTYVLGLHGVAEDIEPAERKSHRGVTVGSAVMNQRLRASASGRRLLGCPPDLTREHHLYLTAESAEGTPPLPARLGREHLKGTIHVILPQCNRLNQS